MVDVAQRHTVFSRLGVALSLLREALSLLEALAARYVHPSAIDSPIHRKQVPRAAREAVLRAAACVCACTSTIDAHAPRTHAAVASMRMRLCASADRIRQPQPLSSPHLAPHSTRQTEMQHDEALDEAADDSGRTYDGFDAMMDELAHDARNPAQLSAKAAAAAAAAGGAGGAAGNAAGGVAGSAAGGAAAAAAAGGLLVPRRASRLERFAEPGRLLSRLEEGSLTLTSELAGSETLRLYASLREQMARLAVIRGHLAEGALGEAHAAAAGLLTDATTAATRIVEEVRALNVALGGCGVRSDCMLMSPASATHDRCAPSMQRSAAAKCILRALPKCHGSRSSASSLSRCSCGSRRIASWLPRVGLSAATMAEVWLGSLGDLAGGVPVAQPYARDSEARARGRHKGAV